MPYNDSVSFVSERMWLVQIPRKLLGTVSELFPGSLR